MNRNDLRRVDMNLLVIFETLMLEKNLTRAKEKLFLEQREVSEKVKRSQPSAAPTGALSLIQFALPFVTRRTINSVSTQLEKLRRYSSSPLSQTRSARWLQINPPRCAAIATTLWTG
jgi:hypothetical protein